MTPEVTEAPACEGQIAELGDVLESRFAGTARIAVIAGSGLGGFARAVKADAEVPFAELPHVGAPTVHGHGGKLVQGTAAGVPIYLMSGRRHLYEGIEARQSTVLLRAMLARFPIETVIISNAAGGLNPTFELADIMLIRDQINWLFRNPLIGPNNNDHGPRFPDLSDVYSRDLAVVAREAAQAAGVTLREGIYAAMHGPSYETKAEVRMLRTVFAADAVGMSTVPEALVAVHMGRKVLGLSVITNLVPAVGLTTHDEVIENGRVAEERFARLINTVLPRL